MTKFLQSLLGLILIITAASAFAVRVATLYEAKVPVASQAIVERNQAIPKALANVLIKLSGSTLVLDNPTVKSQLNLANQWVQEFSYTTAPNGGYWLRVQFDENRVNQFLRDASMPIWGQNRPLITAWIELTAPNHEAEILSNDSNPELTQFVKQAAEQRGLAMMLPMMDVAEMSQVSTQDIETMAVPALVNASKRYGNEAILIGKITRDENGFTSQWKLVLDTNQWDWNFQGKTRDEVITAAVNNVANTFGQRFAIAESHAVQSELTIEIKGIAGQGDFVRLIRYLNHLTPVAKVEVTRIAGEEVWLTLSLRGTQHAFSQAILPGKKLTLVGAETETTPVYQWNH